MACKRRQYCLQEGISRLEMFSPLALLQLRILVHSAIDRLLKHLHLFPPVPYRHNTCCHVVVFLQISATSLSCKPLMQRGLMLMAMITQITQISHVIVILTTREFPYPGIDSPRPRHTFHSCQDVARPKGRFVTRWGASRFKSKKGL